MSHANRISTPTPAWANSSGGERSLGSSGLGLNMGSPQEDPRRGISNHMHNLCNVTQLGWLRSNLLGKQYCLHFARQWPASKKTCLGPCVQYQSYLPSALGLGPVHDIGAQLFLARISLWQTCTAAECKLLFWHCVV